jgi:hypothetical protein
MARNDLRHAYFVAVTLARAARLRSDPSTVTSLREGKREETGLDRYWHGVQYLLAARAKGVRGPLPCLTGGGENLGRIVVPMQRFLPRVRRRKRRPRMGANGSRRLLVLAQMCTRDRLASTGTDGLLALLDLLNRDPILIFAADASISQLVFDRERRVLVGSDTTGAIHILPLLT